MRSIQYSLASMWQRSKRLTWVSLLTSSGLVRSLIGSWRIEDMWRVLMSQNTSYLGMVQTPSGLDPNCQQHIMQTVGRGSSIMVYWKKSLIGDYYAAISCVHLNLFIDFIHPNNNGLFLQDNASCHQLPRIGKDEHSGNFQ